MKTATKKRATELDRKIAELKTRAEVPPEDSAEHFTWTEDSLHIIPPEEAKKLLAQAQEKKPSERAKNVA